MHGGPVHLDLRAELVQRAHIPVTGNGGVHDEATLKAMLETGVDAVMLGRAAITDPARFAALKGYPEPSRRELYLRHIDYLLDFQGQLARTFPNDHVPSPDGFVSVALHRHLFHYFRGIPGAAEIRRRLNTIRTLDETLALAESFS
jgi:tRNA-dihydrouridine synthase